MEKNQYLLYMPAKSEKQKRFMRAVLNFKNKKTSPKNISKKVKDAAKSMTKDQIEDFVNNPVVKNLKESNEFVKFKSIVQNSQSFESFIKNLVGNKLSNLLDMASYARLYVSNKYGLNNPNEDDSKVILSRFLDHLVDFINIRKQSPLRKQLDDKTDEIESNIKNTPEYKDWQDKGKTLRQSYFSEKDPDKKRSLRKDLMTFMKKRPGLEINRNNDKEFDKIIKDFHNTPLSIVDVTPSQNDSEEDKKNYKNAKKYYNMLRDNNISLQESEENISALQQIKDKSFEEVLEQNKGIKFDEKELLALQSKQEGFAGVNSVKFVVNKNKLDEVSTEVFSNDTTKRCVIRKLIDNDTKSLNNYALFVQSIDQNKNLKNIYFILSSLFSDKDDSKIKTLTDFIDRFNSYAL